MLFRSTLLQTENEVKLGFELWPRFADFALFFCAFALNTLMHQYAYQKILASTQKLFSISFRKSTTRSRVKASAESDNGSNSGFLYSWLKSSTN